MAHREPILVIVSDDDVPKSKEALDVYLKNLISETYVYRQLPKQYSRTIISFLCMVSREVIASIKSTDGMYVTDVSMPSNKMGVLEIDLDKTFVEQLMK